MNDSNTIYISHTDDMSHENSMVVPSSNINSTLSKKVAQNRAAQRAFRERKQHYVEDLENKAKELEECKKIMIQLQADNECLRKSVARLETQLNQCLVTNSSLVNNPPSPLHPLLPSPASSLKNRPTTTSPPPSSSPHPQPLQPKPPVASSSSQPSPVSQSIQFKPPLSSSLSKREKKRQRLLANETLHKNDDLQPIQLHSPLTPSYHPYHYRQQQQQEDQVPDLQPQHPIRFLRLLPNDTQDQYIHFVEDNYNHHHPPSQ